MATSTSVLVCVVAVVVVLLLLLWCCDMVVVVAVVECLHCLLPGLYQYNPSTINNDQPHNRNLPRTTGTTVLYSASLLR